jgi:hypothetical protein
VKIKGSQYKPDVEEADTPPFGNLVVNSAGTTPLAGGSGIRISASNSGIPQNSIGKMSEKKNGVPVEKAELEFPISEFR